MNSTRNMIHQPGGEDNDQLETSNLVTRKNPIMPYEDHPRLNKKSKSTLSILLTCYSVIVIAYVIIDLIYWDDLYDSSLEVTKFLRSLPDKIPANYKPESKPGREIYAYLFSNVMYKWAPVILPLGIILHPRKSVGLSYILLYFYNSTLRLLMMQTYRDRRPSWDIDVSDISCKCGFGKPSGHSSNSTMLYCILFYEFWWRFPKRRKGSSFVISILIFTWIIGSILWSRVYYAAHTYSHVIIGHTSAVLLFLIYVSNESRILKFCYRVLTYYSENVKGFIYTTIIMLLSIAIWLVNEVFYDLPSINKRTPGRCLECFSGVDSHGNKLLYGLAYIVVPPAIMLGLMIKGSGKKQGEREDTIFSSDQNASDKIYRYEYDPYHASRRHSSDSKMKNIGQMLLRLIIFGLFIIPYQIS